MRSGLLRAIAAASLVSTLFGAPARGANPNAAVEQPKIDATPFLGDHYPARRIAFAHGVTGYADVAYEVLPGFRPMTLDVYVPAAKHARNPLVLYIHGGGWTTGHSRQSGAFDDFPAVLASLAARGYTVASLNYRLSGEAGFPAAIQDVKAAIKFMRAHDEEYSLDKTRAVVWGGSAGGHLAALAAVTCGVAALEPQSAGASPEATRVNEQSDCVQGAVTWYGVFDLSMVSEANGAPGASPTIRKFLNCGDAACSAAALATASPIHYVKMDSPPFLMIHGSADRTVDPAQSRAFDAAMHKVGAHADLVMIPDVDHSFIGSTPEATRAASIEALHKTFEAIDSFLRPTAAH